MKKQASPSETDWTKVLFEVILKILTLGFYHIRKHQGNNTPDGARG